MPDVKQILNDLMNGTNAVARQKPELIQSFGEFTNEVFKEGTLSVKHKELTALAIGVYARCEYCIVHHVYAALQAGATPEEIMEAAGVAMAFGGGPSMAYTVTLVRESVEAFSQMK